MFVFFVFFLPLNSKTHPLQNTLKKNKLPGPCEFVAVVVVVVVEWLIVVVEDSVTVDFVLEHFEGAEIVLKSIFLKFNISMLIMISDIYCG